MGLNVEMVEKNLRSILSNSITENTVKELCNVVNYDEKTGFENLVRLINAIKLSGDSESAVYCVTTLNNIKKLLLYHLEPEHGMIPTRDINNNEISLGNYLEWLTSNIDTVNKTIYKDNIQLKQQGTKRPLRWGAHEYNDYLKLDLDTYVLCRETLDE